MLLRRDVVDRNVCMFNETNMTRTSPFAGFLSQLLEEHFLDFGDQDLNCHVQVLLLDIVVRVLYNAQTTSAVIYPEGNPELTSYISSASEVPLGTHADVQATNILLHEMFSDKNAHHIASLPEKEIPYTTTTPQPNSLQAKAKKLMHKAKKNMRKINFKKEVARKFREYDQKLEALTNFNISEAFKKAIQERVLTVIKKLLPTHILKAVANYVMPRLNTSVIDVMKNNQINLFTQSSTSIDDLSDMDLNLKLLNRIHLNKSNETHTNHQQLYDTLYDSITLDQDALNAQDANPSFHKRSHDNQDPPNNHKGENKKKRRKDVGQSSSRSSW
ncbi:hypothetical protein Tco_0493459 [Tanacetum coccineum]